MGVCVYDIIYNVYIVCFWLLSEMLLSEHIPHVALNRAQSTCLLLNKKKVLSGIRFCDFSYIIYLYTQKTVLF